ncbi:uncharacterized protein LOC142536915 [Primulina tabacum]|uniref:uncharacterized protein LOC142536915 n=1 Tax=Primulina tabacum TaxID=48773 RepID=UPI003F5A4C19
MSQPIPFDSDEEQNHQETHLDQQSQQILRLNSVNSTILIRQLPSKGLSFQLWPAAAALVTLLDRYRAGHSTTSALSSLIDAQQPHRLRILELGSGTGVVGIAAAALLRASVTITDLPHVLPNMRYNTDANAGILDLCGGDVNSASLSWGNIGEMEAIGREYDVILASDVVYHDHLYEPLIQTLKFYLLGSEKEMVFLMAHLKRWKKESAFFKKAGKLFDVKVLYTDSPCNGARVGVKVYSFVSKG